MQMELCKYGMVMKTLQLYPEYQGASDVSSRTKFTFHFNKVKKKSFREYTVV